MLHLRRTSLSVLVSLVICLTSAGIAKADVLNFGAFLTGAQEVPPRDTPGGGIGIVSLDGNLLSFNITFSGLRSPTVDAHIHCCAPSGSNAIVAVGFPSTGFPLGVTSGSYSNTFDLNNLAIYNPPFVTANGGTLEGARAALLNGLLTGNTYLNIHTMLFPGGEIRGQVNLVPEPATMLLLASGLAGVALKIRRKHRADKSEEA